MVSAMKAAMIVAALANIAALIAILFARAASRSARSEISKALREIETLSSARASRKSASLAASQEAITGPTPEEVRRAIAGCHDFIDRLSQHPGTNPGEGVDPKADHHQTDPLFELTCPDGRTWKLFENGRVEGFPENTLVINRAHPLLVCLRSRIKMLNTSLVASDQA
jgi:hypothetical protein